jgi:hypothetical protein
VSICHIPYPDLYMLALLESMLSSLPVQEASLEMLQLISGLASQVSTWPYYWWYQI